MVVDKRGALVDIGAGWGAFLDNARDHGFGVGGTEICRQMSDYASVVLKIPVANKQLERTAWRMGDISVVTALHSLEHLPNQKTALEYIHNLLEPGGWFCGIVPNFDSFMSQAQGDSWYWLDSNFHYIHFTPGTLDSTLRRFGFEPKRIYTAHDDFDPALIKAELAKHGDARTIQQLEAQGSRRGDQVLLQEAMNAVIIHPLGYEDRPRGHEPDHFEVICNTLTKRGHVMLPEHRISEADVLLFDSGVWHLNSRCGATSPYTQDVLKCVLHNHISVVWFDNFDHAGNDKSEGRWPGSDDWSDLKAKSDGDWSDFGVAMSRPGACRLLYFMRKMQIHQNYPKYVYPLEYPIFEDYPLATQQQLCSRPMDVCGLFNVSGPRIKAIAGLKFDDRLTVDCELVHHAYRLEHDDWIARHRQAKFFLEADASLGSERPMRLITVAPMLRVKSDHRIPFPRQDMVHCVVVGDYDGTITGADIDKILGVISNPDLLYSIYVNGAEHMRRHYSLQTRSDYVVDLVEKFVENRL